jgi:phosphotriesterase-related protein
MANSFSCGEIQTVTGPIDTGSLGWTSAHEHVLFDMSVWAVEPEDAEKKKWASEPLSLENLHRARANRLVNLDNMRQTDEQLAISELLLFKKHGGGTIVELSQHGLLRNPAGLQRVAEATGLNIVMGCGYYVAETHPEELARKTADEIAAELIKDLTTGVADTGIRAGIIGEIGCSIPLHVNEKKVLRAAAMAQQQTGAAINVHPSFDDRLVLENIQILREAGANLRRTIISHIDQNDYSWNTCLKIAEAGCFLEYDAFGHLGYPHLEQGRLLNLTGDIERVRKIIALIQAGRLGQILIGQDVCFKDCLTAYGGFGYAHILTNVVPLMTRMGLSDAQIQAILVENPQRALSI